MAGGKRALAKAGAFCAALALALMPATADAAKPQKRRAARAVQLTAPLGTFTPAAADPRAAASFARGGLDAGGFRFTPSATPGSRRAVTVAVRARQARGDAKLAGLAQGTITPLTPSAYSLGVSVGWKRFAITSDLVKVDTGPLPGARESADLALTYGGRRWSTRLAIAADRTVGPVARLVEADESYSADLGASYAITRNLDVTGGVRYRVERDRLQPLADLRRDSQAVYLGTAFRF